MQSSASTPRCNIGVRSGMKTRSASGDVPTLEQLFKNLQEGLLEQLEEQRRLFDSRWEEERARAEERRQAEEAASSARAAAQESRMEVLEGQQQTLAAKFDAFVQSHQGTVSARRGRGLSPVYSVESVRPATPPPTLPLPLQEGGGAHRGVSELGYVLRPPTFDGNSSWEEFLIQFEAVAKSNGWDEPRKALALVSSLEGPARGVLSSLFAAKRENFEELTLALEFRYGAKNFTQLNYVKFQNYKQRKGESISELASEIERLAQAAFADCPAEAQDKLAASQFISALANSEMKRTLRLGSFSTLRAVVLRALEIEAVGTLSDHSNEERDTRCGNLLQGTKDMRKRTFHTALPPKPEKNSAECWNCGKTGHLQRNCPKKQMGKQDRRRLQENTKKSA